VTHFTLYSSVERVEDELLDDGLLDEELLDGRELLGEDDELDDFDDEDEETGAEDELLAELLVPFPPQDARSNEAARK